MRHFDFQLTSEVYFGAENIDRLGELTATLAARSVLLVTDPGIVAAGHAGRAIDSLRQAGLRVTLFQEVEENPTTRHVVQGVRCAQEAGDIDVIVGLGGGSAMDCAKGINFLLTNGGKMEDYWGIGKAKQPMLPSIGVPTTAGTGSEAQSFALISQEESHVKMACGDRKARFRKVILDPTLARSAPPDVIAATGLDAISHAIESYVTSKRTPFSQMLAREAWRLLAAHFRALLQDRADTKSWGMMLLGAHYAGAAIENSMLGAAHACANPLTAAFGITHGLAVALMLPHVVLWNSAAVNGEYDELARAAGLNTVDAGAAAIAETIAALRSVAGAPQRLRDCGIGRDDLRELAQQAAKQWTGTFNPRPLEEHDFLSLYESAF